MNRQELIVNIAAKGSFLCVGIDPEPGKLPAHLGKGMAALEKYCTEIIDATREHCVAYKPNMAFFECLGPEGWEVLERLVKHIGMEHMVIADAKRGDIGNTAEKYAQTFFQRYGFDAVTIAPYMGRDSAMPFLAFRDKWSILLALTSNPGAADFQLLSLEDGELLYERVVKEASTWGHEGNTMFVVGATRPEHLASVRRLVPRHFLLVPGVGAQGGSLEEVCRHGLNADVGLLVNSSRAILYASAATDFAKAAAIEAGRMASQMKRILQEKGVL